MAMPAKFEVGSYSPLIYTIAGALAVPRLTVWLTWLVPEQLLATVTWFTVVVDDICSPWGGEVENAQVWVLLITWVCGLAARFVTNDWITVGFSEESGAIVVRPVVS